MDLHSIKAGISKIYGGVKRLAQLECALAAVCLFIPLFLIVCDHFKIRESISAYYSMDLPQVFYFSLTVAVMLFIVNGTVMKKRFYNILLGLMLTGVILFNHDKMRPLQLLLHNTFAMAFFGGSAVVIFFFTSKKVRWFKWLILVIAASMLGCYAFHWFTLFWAEWISFAIIAWHYIIVSWGAASPSSPLPASATPATPAPPRQTTSS